MSWRKRLLLRTGPGLLGGITFGDWLALLRDNHFAVDPPYWWRASVITMRSIINSYGRWREEASHNERVEKVSVEPPLFILGIWRSGTTHLQNLFALDSRFASPNWFQVSYPHTFLRSEGKFSRLENFFVPRERIQDNMQFGFEFPAEEEFALCTVTSRSAMLSWVFPRRAANYDRYLTLREVAQDELTQWNAALLWFVKKLTWKYRKPLVLKSPPHTARIRLLLELFPDARFVHIYRNPYVVFQSAAHTHREVMKYVTLQQSIPDVEEQTICQYKEVFDAFFEERGLIPTSHYHEVRFEDLERDPVGQLRSVYEGLGLPDFSQVEPSVSRYTASLTGYKKNVYPEIPPATKSRIVREWRRCFDEWNYPL
jgi:hypothetical protein